MTETFAGGDLVAVQLARPAQAFPGRKAGDWIPGNVTTRDPDGHYAVQAEGDPAGASHVLIAGAHQLRHRAHG
jgi:hypothetical protein